MLMKGPIVVILAVSNSLFPEPPNEGACCMQKLSQEYHDVEWPAHGYDRLRNYAFHHTSQNAGPFTPSLLASIFLNETDL